MSQATEIQVQANGVLKAEGQVVGIIDREAGFLDVDGFHLPQVLSTNGSTEDMVDEACSLVREMHPLFAE